LAEERAGGGKHEKFTKYKKTFLMELMDIRKFEPTSKIYDTFVQMTDINTRINSFQQAYSKLDFDNPNEETQKRARELQRVAEDYRERL
jgi:vacuolar-type H+-ATPase catalytic subunit A/Vma1